MSSFIEGQMHQLADSLQAAGYTAGDLTRLGQAGKEKLRQIRSVLLGSAIIQMVKRIITRVPFEPNMIAQGWTWWLGPNDGKGLKGEELDCDPRSLALVEVDFTQVLREICLKEKEPSIGGEEKLQRLIESGVIRLDPAFGWSLYQEEGQKTLRWLYDTFGVTYLDFFGRVLRGPDGRRYVLYLSRNGNGSWDWGVIWLVDDWGAGYASVALPAKLVS